MPKIVIHSDNGEYVGEPIEVSTSEFDETDEGQTGGLQPDVREWLWPELVRQLEAAAKVDSGD